MHRFAYWMVALLGILLLPGVAASADPAKDAMQKGKACFEKGDNDGAVAAYSEAIRLDPKNAEAYRERGVAYHEKADLEKAITDFSAAIRSRFEGRIGIRLPRLGILLPTPVR